MRPRTLWHFLSKSVEGLAGTVLGWAIKAGGGARSFGGLATLFAKGSSRESAGGSEGFGAGGLEVFGMREERVKV